MIIKCHKEIPNFYAKIPGQRPTQFHDLRVKLYNHEKAEELGAVIREIDTSIHGVLMSVERKVKDIPKPQNINGELSAFDTDKISWYDLFIAGRAEFDEYTNSVFILCAFPALSIEYYNPILYQWISMSSTDTIETISAYLEAVFHDNQ